MRWLLVLVILYAGIFVDTQAQLLEDDPAVMVSEVVDDAVVFCDGIQFFRRNYDGFSVEESLMAAREIKTAGADIQAAILELESKSNVDKSETKHLNKIHKRIRSVGKALDKLSEYIKTQNYKSKSPSPGGHSPVETRYFKVISDDVKDIRAAVSRIT